MVSNQFRSELLAAIPGLRAFGISLTARHDCADDLVQETLMKAWAHHESFEMGTNIKAWLYTILRNEFYSHLRKKAREVEDVDGFYASRVAVPGEQQGHLDMGAFKAALMQLPADQREAIILVGASGFSYDESADICGVAVGTIKSRVSRARRKLAELMHIENSTDFHANISFQIGQPSSALKVAEG